MVAVSVLALLSSVAAWAQEVSQAREGALGQDSLRQPHRVAQATPYPHEIVTLLTHSSPGSGSDLFLRELARHLGPQMGVDFVVEHVPGGGGARAMSRLANAEPDGSVFYAATPSFIFTSLLSRPANTFRDLEPLVNVFFDQEVVYTRSDGPFETFAQVIDSARTGRGRWGAASPGSLERQALERLRLAADVRAAIVTHDGGGDLILNVLNGTLDIGVGEAQEIRSQLDSGNLRLLAVFSDARLPELPQVPTVHELGYDIVVTKFRGLMGPRGLPADVVAAWERGVRQVLDDPEYRSSFTRAMLTPAFMGQADFARFVDGFASDTETFFRDTGVIQ
ncbi:MAG: tripartite tricarboxylate transporter substrate binding protein [Rhodospirillaceae bacterium]|nr:tripartite tricarboxylate transporter substrate binding protein [Rhodospirillaceae bacterium]